MYIQNDFDLRCIVEHIPTPRVMNANIVTLRSIFGIYFTKRQKKHLFTKGLVSPGNQIHAHTYKAITIMLYIGIIN